MHNILSKSGYQGDNLIGFSGFCEKCGEERRIYYVKCRDDIKSKLIKGFRTGVLKYSGICEVCILDNVRDTVKTWRLMSRQDVDADLSILDQFINIDFDKAASDASENEKNDRWLSDNEQHVKEYKKFRRMS